MKLPRKLIPLLTGLLLTLVVLWLEFSDAGMIRSVMARLDFLIYDLRLSTTLEDKPSVDPRVVIVDIDEKSIQAEGHWPWSRDKLAKLLDKIFDQGTAVAAFDIVFAEGERNDASDVLAAAERGNLLEPKTRHVLKEIAPSFDHDRIFAASMADRDVVLGYIFTNHDRPPSGAAPPPVPTRRPAVDALSVITLPSYTSNIPALQKAAAHAGFFSLLPDPDGIVRRAPMLIRYHGQLYPSLSLEAVRLFFLVDKIGIASEPVGEVQAVDSIRVGPTTIPTDAYAQAMIPYRGKQGSFQYVSATDLLHDRVPSGTLENKIALIGTTAQGLFDLRATPMQPVYPGVEAHANLIAGMLDNRFPVTPSWADGANFLLTLGTGLLLALALPFLPALSLVFVTALVAAGQFAFNFWLWASKGYVLTLAPILTLILLIASLNLAYGFLFESRGRRQLKGAFGQYVPPELVEEMSRNPERYGFEGESRELTILFADIRSFTTISESLSPNALKKLLNRFFTPMTRIIFQRRGTIDKYVGDMIMAFWGAPVADKEHAAHAIEAALDMLREVERLKDDFRADGLPEVEIGIGLNTGTVNVGDMGSEFRRAYTVIGDAVNLASRLEGTTKYYGARLVVGERTRQEAGEKFVFRELDYLRVKGKAKAIRIFEPVCRAEEAQEAVDDRLARYHRALELYRNRQWDEADDIFAALAAEEPDVGVYRLYRQRIEELRGMPEDEAWDGVYDRQVK
jgi:adenylate cyclase